jgi:hypothetical protein
MHFSVFLPIQFVKDLTVFFIYKENTVVLPLGRAMQKKRSPLAGGKESRSGHDNAANHGV